MKMAKISGINMQWPWSELLLNGKKCIETRNYKLPDRLKNQPIAIIETPGKRKDFKARITGIIIFTESKEYSSKKAWLLDFDNHLVDPNDNAFKYNPDKKKHGWLVGKYCRLQEPLMPPKSRGIVYATNCLVPERILRNLI